jgi:hypothetical protein
MLHLFAQSEDKQYLVTFKSIITRGLLKLATTVSGKLPFRGITLGSTIKYFYLEIYFDCLHLRYNLTYKVNDQHRQCYVPKINKCLVVSHAIETWPLTP